MLRNPTQARRYTQPIELLYAAPSVDEYGHVSLGAPEPVLSAFAHVEQMSATKTMMTFQQADVVGVEIEMRWTDKAFNGIRWQGHDIVFSHPENVGERNRIIRIAGYYQIQNPI